jgi:hypothetical protein
MLLRLTYRLLSKCSVSLELTDSRAPQFRGKKKSDMVGQGFEKIILRFLLIANMNLPIVEITKSGMTYHRCSPREVLP